MSFKKIQVVAQIVGLVTIAVLSVLGVLALAGKSAPILMALGSTNLSRVPNVINYQGMLRRPDGTPVNGEYDMTFRLYDEPTLGTVLHTETLAEVVVHDGLFTVLLGDAEGNPINPVAFRNRLYVGIQVGSDAEMTPRQRIAPVPYAVQLTDGLYVDGEGDVGVGTTTPTQKLEVDNGNLLVQGAGSFSGSGDEALVYLGDENHFIKSNYDTGVTIGTFNAPNGIVLQQGTGDVTVNKSLSWTGTTTSYMVKHLHAGKNSEAENNLGNWDLCAVLSYEVTGSDSSTADWGYCTISFDATTNNNWGDQPKKTFKTWDQPNWYFKVRANHDVDGVNCEAICINLGH